MPVIEKAYAFAVTLPIPVSDARERAIAALREEGFGVLTEIDVAATMKARLGVDGPPYVILGACNPPLAHAAMEADPTIGALLPCNVVVRAVAGGTVIEIMDPAAVLGIAGLPSLAPLGAEARTRLLRVAGALAR
ncbi:MAG: DUF302 domain-containing protein [Chloroflexota bacterium]